MGGSIKTIYKKVYRGSTKRKKFVIMDIIRWKANKKHVYKNTKKQECFYGPQLFYP